MRLPPPPAFAWQRRRRRITLHCLGIPARPYSNIIFSLCFLYSSMFD